MKIPFISPKDGMVTVDILVPSTLNPAFPADRKKLVTELEKVVTYRFLHDQSQNGLSNFDENYDLIITRNPATITVNEVDWERAMIVFCVIDPRNSRRRLLRSVGEQEISGKLGVCYGSGKRKNEPADSARVQKPCVRILGEVLRDLGFKKGLADLGFIEDTIEAHTDANLSTPTNQQAPADAGSGSSNSGSTDMDPSIRETLDGILEWLGPIGGAKGLPDYLLTMSDEERQDYLRWLNEVYEQLTKEVPAYINKAKTFIEESKKPRAQITKETIRMARALKASAPSPEEFRSLLEGSGYTSVQIVALISEVEKIEAEEEAERKRQEKKARKKAKKEAKKQAKAEAAKNGEQHDQSDSDLVIEDPPAEKSMTIGKLIEMLSNDGKVDQSTIPADLLGTDPKEVWTQSQINEYLKANGVKLTTGTIVQFTDR